MSKVFTIAAAVAAILVLQPQVASAHCDALDGPVVTAAKTALDRNDVALVLRWVPPDREAEVRSAFERTVTVRAAGGEAQALAETWFFETLVRFHRAGEGASFDGLKPAGHIEPFVAAVDQSLQSGAPNEVIDTISAHVTFGLRDRFARARDAKVKADHSVAAGRVYVAAYVDYLHYIEALLGAGGAPWVEHQELSGVWRLHETGGELPEQAVRALDGKAEGSAGVTIQVDQTTADVTVRRLGNPPVLLRVMPFSANAIEHQVPGGGLWRGRAEWREQMLVANGHVAVKQGFLKRNVPFEEAWQIDESGQTLTVTTTLNTPLGVKRRTQVFVRVTEAAPATGDGRVADGRTAEKNLQVM